MNALAATTLPGTDSGARWSLAPHRPAPRAQDRQLVAVAARGRDVGSFEEAEAFLLYEKCNGETCFVGRQPCPFAGADPALRARLLADCDLVVCSAIGDDWRRMLSQLGVGCELGTHRRMTA